MGSLFFVLLHLTFESLSCPKGKMFHIINETELTLKKKENSDTCFIPLSGIKKKRAMPKVGKSQMCSGDESFVFFHQWIG